MDTGGWGWVVGGKHGSCGYEVFDDTYAKCDETFIVSYSGYVSLDEGRMLIS